MNNGSRKQQDFQDTPGLDQYVTVAQAAQILQVSEDYIRKLIKNENLQSIKLPGGPRSPVRIPVEALKKIVTKQLAKKSRPHRIRAKRNSRRVYHGVFLE